jgi:hypothetical protein
MQKSPAATECTDEEKEIEPPRKKMKPVVEIVEDKLDLSKKLDYSYLLGQGLAIGVVGGTYYYLRNQQNNNPILNKYSNL